MNAPAVQLPQTFAGVVPGLINNRNFSPKGYCYTYAAPAEVGPVQPLQLEFWVAKGRKGGQWVLAHAFDGVRYPWRKVRPGHSHADKTAPRKGGAIESLWAPRGGWAFIEKVNKVSVSIRHAWSYGGREFSKTIPFDKIAGVMTPEQVEEARKAGRLVLVDTAAGRAPIGFRLLEPSQPAKVEPLKEDLVCPDGGACPDAECIAERGKQGIPTGPPFDIKAMRESLAAGVQVATSPTLFPTPRDLAERMTYLADIRAGHRVLEPSAGTGNIVTAIREAHPEANVTAVELSLQLANGLASRCQGVPVIPGDFLEKEAFELGAPFDRIVMNPPFNGGADIKHILHARSLLNPGGVLVAICAGGPRQLAALEPLSDLWEPLPAGTFAQVGTNVNTVLLTMGAAS